MDSMWNFITFLSLSFHILKFFGYSRYRKVTKTGTFFLALQKKEGYTGFTLIYSETRGGAVW